MLVMEQYSADLVWRVLYFGKVGQLASGIWPHLDVWLVYVTESVGWREMSGSLGNFSG